ncbi:O-acetylhomoserine aminocarboxypropyltransferase/cysteine synthase family protein [Actinobacillus pleuropneumoniae]|uniref:O-acetylhomoserine (Thiol)-lyase n=2 Tax=Actinobacillus pleuropneumoniae TaxID=715 RepID=B3GXD6_ACTP7|nr:aminotransferase class I/II-fold pyridoxal phosphate-dependent enzyme [Actinobacillus pleuropneumoniae]ACE61395.1 O-acetylhomoserine (thiol)-lyase [Actinobacillus pleuropneumoniae serovar 7 str. AP76]EFL80874.1 putative cystathionine beta-lyase [Actinobacillus pleuropneumoniae serovar 6 str. Femo]EFM92194.1 O-acetylhomoserine/O-acetylserine sulfhydrylase [Actinobacillus pleuropneumoniae serovar 6 str. Femo]EFN03131.1 O-acetylhomoserine/O-acetylserine sulfhydrylase [Actinobacillus pleuropneum
MNFETLCLHAGYTPKNGEPRALPIVQSTTFTYDSAESIGKLFDLEEAGFFYTRLANPTTNAVEEKIAALEGGVAAMCTASGQSAVFYALMNLLESGDHFISASSIYGGSYNLFAHTFRKMGIEVTFVDQFATIEELKKAIRPNTKAVFGETIANPALRVLDIEKFAALAQAAECPLVVDNTFATPYFCRPFEFGANIVVHSSSKYLDGHAVALGGVIIDGGNFDWNNPKFKAFHQPDETYHGLVYTETFGKAAYMVKARVQLMRDLGATPAPQNSFLLNLGLETLSLRMKQHFANAKAVAEFLEAHPQVKSVYYPALASSPDFALQQKYTPNGLCGVLSFELKGNKETAMKWLNALKLVSREVHVADIRTCALHPATSTHRQLSTEDLKAANISETLIRLSVGIETLEDILADLTQAFEQAV